MEARIEELKRNPSKVWRRRWPDPEPDVSEDYAASVDDAFEGRPKRADASPDYEEGWASHFENVERWKQLMKARRREVDG